MCYLAIQIEEGEEDDDEEAVVWPPETWEVGVKCDAMDDVFDWCPSTVSQPRPHGVAEYHGTAWCSRARPNVAEHGLEKPSTAWCSRARLGVAEQAPM